MAIYHFDPKTQTYVMKVPRWDDDLKVYCDDDLKLVLGLFCAIIGIGILTTLLPSFGEPLNFESAGRFVGLVVGFYTYQYGADVLRKTLWTTSLWGDLCLSLLTHIAPLVWFIFVIWATHQG